ncbi:MAG TPA: hypothetical protein EYQ22_10890 [Gammaproteobacteria bacterium]|nr:hypothetical protein [Gammaproteobacteria bacterium]HIK69812.1 hypothetical protein [Pseudomonadales bacterium]
MNPLLFQKTTHRLVYDTARLGQGDCDDVLLWNERYEITETTIYNIYLGIACRLFTALPRSGLSPRVTDGMMPQTGQTSELLLYLNPP